MSKTLQAAVVMVCVIACSRQALAQSTTPMKFRVISGAVTGLGAGFLTGGAGGAVVGGMKRDWTSSALLNGLVGGTVFGIGGIPTGAVTGAVVATSRSRSILRAVLVGAATGAATWPLLGVGGQPMVPGFGAQRLALFGVAHGAVTGAIVAKWIK